MKEGRQLSVYMYCTYLYTIDLFIKQDKNTRLVLHFVLIHIKKDDNIHK